MRQEDDAAVVAAAVTWRSCFDEKVRACDLRDEAIDRYHDSVEAVTAACIAEEKAWERLTVVLGRGGDVRQDVEQAFNQVAQKEK